MLGSTYIRLVKNSNIKKDFYNYKSISLQLFIAVADDVLFVSRDEDISIFLDGELELELFRALRNCSGYAEAELVA